MQQLDRGRARRMALEFYADPAASPHAEEVSEAVQSALALLMSPRPQMMNDEEAEKRQRALEEAQAAVQAKAAGGPADD